LFSIDDKLSTLNISYKQLISAFRAVKF
jgi:hypothetical protein